MVLRHSVLANWLVECFSLVIPNLWYLANWIFRSLFPSTQGAVTRFNPYGFLVWPNITLYAPADARRHCRGGPGRISSWFKNSIQGIAWDKKRKSSGPDCIPSRVLKLFAFELAPVITDLYNTSLVQGVVPSQFKSCLVVPIPKTTPPKTVEEDLRPITLTSQLAKIMEGFTLNLLPVYKQMVDQLNKKQFAVRGKSTTHALVYLVHCIQEYLDKGACYVRLFLADFSKGVDLVDHTVLMLELRSLGVHDAIIGWITDFLSYRSQRVKIGDAISPCVFSNGGIPQGTKLAPILFAVLVNKLVAGWYTRVKYVDDLSVLECIPRCSPSCIPCIAK